MPEIRFEFDKQKAIEVMLYLVKRVNDPTLLVVMKLFYLADKTSLERYGRFIAGDTYCAIEKGPVPSNLYDLLKTGRETDINGFRVVNGRNIKPLRDANLDYLSDSDIACLNQAIALYGNLPPWQIAELSHDDAWAETWAERGDRGSIPMPIERIVSQFDESEDLLDYLQNPIID